MLENASSTNLSFPTWFFKIQVHLGHNFESKHQNFAVHSDKDKLSWLFVRFFSWKLIHQSRALKLSKNQATSLHAICFRKILCYKYSFCIYFSKYTNIIYHLKQGKSKTQIPSKLWWKIGHGKTYLHISHKLINIYIYIYFFYR